VYLLGHADAVRGGERARDDVLAQAARFDVNGCRRARHRVRYGGLDGLGDVVRALDG
jgi:hypothetical protein